MTTTPRTILVADRPLPAELAERQPARVLFVPHDKGDFWGEDRPHDFRLLRPIPKHDWETEQRRAVANDLVWIENLFAAEHQFPSVVNKEPYVSNRYCDRYAEAVRELKREISQRHRIISDWEHDANVHGEAAWTRAVNVPWYGRAGNYGWSAVAVPGSVWVHAPDSGVSVLHTYTWNCSPAILADALARLAAVPWSGVLVLVEEADPLGAEYLRLARHEGVDALIWQGGWDWFGLAKPTDEEANRRLGAMIDRAESVSPRTITTRAVSATKPEDGEGVAS